MQVPSPWLTSSTKRVVKQVCAVDSEAKVVARPSMKRTWECILVADRTGQPKKEKNECESKGRCMPQPEIKKQCPPREESVFISRGEPKTNG